MTLKGRSHPNYSMILCLKSGYLMHSISGSLKMGGGEEGSSKIRSLLAQFELRQSYCLDISSLQWTSLCFSTLYVRDDSLLTQSMYADKAQQPGRTWAAEVSLMFYGSFLLLQFNTIQVLSDVRHGTSIPNIQLSFRKILKDSTLQSIWILNQVIA